MAGKKKIVTVCGYSCSDCDHLGRECKGCEKTKGKPFWTAFVDADVCPVYDCCVNGRKLPHCGKCAEMICERFTRFKDPGMSEEQLRETLAAIERELRARK
jgi:predicted PP-loop superfamily ATPase